MLEIERKFLIDSFPELPVWEEKHMWQGYLATAPVVRIRRTQTADAASCVLCIKGEGSLIRKEIELPLSREQFEELAGLLEGPMIEKIQRVYQLPGGLKLECNCVDRDRPPAFWYAEVEFPTKEAGMAFEPPAFLGKEVTEQSGFSMREYWLRRLGEMD